MSHAISANLDPEDNSKTELSEQDKLFIMMNFETMSLGDMAKKISGDPKIHGQHKIGRAIKEFLVSKGAKVKTTKFEAAGPLELSEEEMEFCRNNYDKMKLMEITKLAFKNDKLSSLSREFKAIQKYIGEIAPNFIKKPDVHTDEEYLAVKSIYKLIPIVNKYIVNPKKEGMALYDFAKLEPQDERNLRGLLGYLNVFRFAQQINKYTKQEDRDLFESTFIRHCYDKPDLSQEEVDQYIALASKIVTVSQLQTEEQFFRDTVRDSMESSDLKKLSLSFVEALDNARDKLKETQGSIDKLTKDLSGTRAERLDSKATANASFLNLVEAFQHKERRDEVIKMAELQKEEEEKQIDKLFSMDDLKALIAGVTKEEMLGRQ